MGRAFKMLKSINGIILLVGFILLSMTIVLQARSTAYKNQLKNINALSVEKLTSRINEEKKLENELKAQIELLNEKIDSYLKASINEKTDNAPLLEYEKLKVQAGLTDVQGAGIIIKLDDAPARAEGDWQKLIIHDSDIKIILNELKAAGAQAISINGERIVPTSEIFCAGPNITINGNKYPVPYQINAIGDADVLYDSLSKSERILLMIEDKIRIDIRKSGNVVIPKYSGYDNISKKISSLEVVKK